MPPSATRRMTPIRRFGAERISRFDHDPARKIRNGVHRTADWNYII
jgi:hypothetical protein